ncbi:MAG: hypothetical protein ACWIPI_00350 [Polaribacter sp.]
MEEVKKEFLDSFFSLFKAKVKITQFTEEEVFGILKWEDDDDIQNFKWYNIFSNEALIILKELCYFIKKLRLNDNDKIIIAERELRNKLSSFNWKNSKIEKGIDALTSINIKMVDEGEETDSFFIHF